MSEPNTATTFVDRIVDLIEPAVIDLGYSLVRVQVIGRQRPRVQVMIERRDDRPTQVDDCAAVSRTISVILDVADPISGPYTLEVSSPGIDRPLVRLADYDRFAGYEARVELSRPLSGRRRLQGRVLGTSGETVRLQVGDDEWAVPIADVQRAKLVLTDDLLRAAARTPV